MSINFKRIADVPVIETISEGDTLLVNSNGAAMQIDASKVGGNSLDTTVTHYTLGAPSIAGEPAFGGEYGYAYYCIIPGNFSYDQLTGTKYTENVRYDIPVGDGDQTIFRQEEYTINRSDWEAVDEPEKYAKTRNIHVFREGDCILIDSDHEGGQVMHTVATPGVYFRKDLFDEEAYLIEMDLAVSTVIDERCLPLNAITKSDLITYQVNWEINDRSDPRYIQERPFYSTEQSYEWSDWSFRYEEDPVIVDTPEGHEMYLIDSSFDDDYDWSGSASVFVEEDHVARTISSRYIHVDRYEDGMVVAIDDDGVFIEEGYGLKLFIYVPHDNCDVSEYFGDDWSVVFPRKGLYALRVSENKFVTGFKSGRVAKIEERYIPELSQVILKSSTPYSYKKFKITVDDSGNLTTTEITE